VGTFTRFYGATGVVAQRDPAKGLAFYFKDHLGSTRNIQTTAARMRVNYYPFGEQHTVTGDETNHLFTGKELDNTTDLYYFGARYYDPSIGRFISVDPLAEKYPGWSPYVYALDNPLKFIDPDGRQSNDTEEDDFGWSDLFTGFRDHVNSVFNVMSQREQQNNNDNSQNEKEKQSPPKSGTSEELGEFVAAETMDFCLSNEFYVSIGFDKQTSFAPLMYGQITYTSSGSIVLSGGIDHFLQTSSGKGMHGIGAPLSVSFGIVKKLDGTRASGSDFTGWGVTQTSGIGVGYEVGGSLDGNSYTFGMVFSPAAWHGALIDRGFKLK
jgi:RHS repeat-associated protein